MPVLPFPNDRNEWVGGVYTLPFDIEHEGVMVRPRVAMLLELATDILLATQMDVGDPLFANVVAEAMLHPAVGAPRRPARIRVPEAKLAEELRGVAGKDIEIVVAPVPELDAVFDELVEHTAPQPDPTYLGGGTISPAKIGRLFAAAKSYCKAAPWKELDDRDHVSVDIPELGIEEAILSVIGSLGESFGLLLFPSLEEYDAVADPSPQPVTEPGDGSELFMLSLSFNSKKDLPHSLLAEIAEHGWPVAGPKGYPVLFAVDKMRQWKPTTEEHVRMMTACASAFTQFYKKHRQHFDHAHAKPLRETFVEEGLELILTR